MTIAGIDPGVEGGIAFIEPETQFACPLPYNAKVLDCINLRELLVGGNIRVFIEKPMLMGRQAGGLVIGTNYGRILATLELLRIPYREVAPNTWKSKLLGKTEGKGAAIALAKQLFPSVELVQPGCRKPHDGVAEALLIGEWGRRHG